MFDPHCRGAAGRLMKLESMQTLLDDFSIPLQIGMSGNQENDKSKVNHWVYLYLSVVHQNVLQTLWSFNGVGIITRCHSV